MISPELRELAAAAFALAGGSDPSQWPYRVELGLATVAVMAVVGLCVVGLVWARR